PRSPTPTSSPSRRSRSSDRPTRRAVEAWRPTPRRRGSPPSGRPATWSSPWTRGRRAARVLEGYAVLTPDTTWDPTRGYGWVGAPPQARDRQVLDPLRRDFVFNREVGTLRLAVPPGVHR